MRNQSSNPLFVVGEIDVVEEDNEEASSPLIERKKARAAPFNPPKAEP